MCFLDTPIRDLWQGENSFRQALPCLPKLLEKVADAALRRPRRSGAARTALRPLSARCKRALEIGHFLVCVSRGRIGF